MTYNEIIKDGTARTEKALSHTSEMLKGIRTSRASSALVEHIRVDYYGTPTPLSQIAQISIPEPRTIVIKAFDVSSLEDVGKAILKSDLGISPENDGKVIRLSMPPLSGDQRKKYAARAKEMCEEGRIAMRNVRRDINKRADQIQRSGELTKDDNERLHGDIQKLLKEYEGKLGELQEKKTTEIMQV